MNRLQSILCLFFACLGVCNLAVAADMKRPNILFIYADDQSYKTLSCYDGHPNWVKTPNIDGLASTGVRFERSYLGAWCMPSRASLLTGKLQHAIMSMTMEGQYPGSKYDPVQCPFIPAQFRAQGYQTAQIGKWHTGTDTGYGRDWDYQIVWNRPGHPENAGNYYENQVLTFNGVDKPTEGYSTDNYTQWAAEYIEGKNRDPNKPWYLWLCYGAVHGPTTPAARHKGKLDGQQAIVPADIVGPRENKPAYLDNTQAWGLDKNGRPAMAKKNKKKDNFDGGAEGKPLDNWVQQVNECNMAVDEGVGKVLDALKKSGQLENTLIVYTADQGYALGEHGLNQKVAPYDASVSSPLIISWAGKYPAGQVCKHPINATDLVDFLCKAANVNIPWKTHGRDIRPLLENPTTPNWNSPLLMTSTSRNYGAETDKIPSDDSLTSSSGVPWYALLRDGNYKYIRYFVEGETEELYDLEKDPEELKNLAAYPDQMERLAVLREKTKGELRRTDARFVDILPKTRAELKLVSAPTAASFSLVKQDNKVILKYGDSIFTEYVFNDPQTNKTYLWPIFSASGHSMTRAYPMEEVEGEQHDHPHHRGIWFGHEDINGSNSWAEAKSFGGKKNSSEPDPRSQKLGKQVHRTFRSLQANGNKAVIESELDYVDSSGKKLITEHRTMSFEVDGNLRLIDMDQEFIASEGEVTLGGNKDAGLSIRVPTTMAVDSKKGGAIVSSEGHKDKDAWAKRARWVDYSGPNPTNNMGVAMFNHPSSFRSPTNWHVRTYGLFTANAFGTKEFESPNGPTTLKAGEKLVLRHRFVLYEGTLDSDRLESLYNAYAQEK